MTEKDLRYVILVLKGEKPKNLPNWYTLLGFLFSHRIAGLFYKRAQKCGVNLPKKVENLLKLTFEQQKRKVNFMRNELSHITQKLSKSKVPYMLLKGSVLSNLNEKDKKIYFDGERISNDIDLLCQQDGITAISKALYELGFVQGVYDYDSDMIKKFSRLEIVKRRMNRGEIAPFVKKTENPEFPYIEVDINFSLGNTPLEGATLLKDMVMETVEYKGKVLMRIPNIELFFLHLIMHQYKESCLLFMVEHNKDLDVYKLADIYYLFKTYTLDFEYLESMIKKYSLYQEIGTVLKQVGEVFIDDEIVKYANKFNSFSPFIVDYENKKNFKWSGTVFQRLCSLDSKRYLSEVNYD